MSDCIKETITRRRFNSLLDKAVALNLARWADEADGDIYTSPPRLGAETGINEAMVPIILQELEDGAFGMPPILVRLSLEGAPIIAGGMRRYQFLMDAVEAMPLEPFFANLVQEAGE